jgi:anti-sigma regulatory factor (Ser/Thr protein kinase)
MAPHLQALDAFVTLTYLRIDVKANTLTWIGCGHEESLVISAGGLVTALGNQHPPMGLFLDEAYSQDVCDLLPGDAVFLCSDGASDAILNNGERLGHELLRDTVRRHTLSHQTPAMVIHALRRDLLLDQVTIADDLTMVMLLRHDLQRNLARMEVPASLESLRPVREFIAAQSARLSEKVAGPLTVAAVEVITNVIRHATELVSDAPIELLAESSASGLQLDFKYLGAKFEPPVDPPAIDFAAYPEGGLGLGIISGATDRVDYLHHEGVNTVRLWIDYRL